MASGSGPNNQPIVGTAMSNDDVEMLKRFRTSFLPDVKIQEQETVCQVAVWTDDDHRRAGDRVFAHQRLRSFRAGAIFFMRQQC